MHQIWTCSFCGTRWQFEATSNRSGGRGSAAGFIWAHIANHIAWCRHATVDERLRWIADTRKRISRRPPQHTIYLFDEKYAAQQQNAVDQAMPDESRAEAETPGN